MTIHLFDRDLHAPLYDGVHHRVERTGRHRSGEWTLSERVLLLSMASVIVTVAMALLTAGPFWLAAVAVFVVIGLWAAARITAGDLVLPG